MNKRSIRIVASITLFFTFAAGLASCSKTKSGAPAPTKEKRKGYVSLSPAITEELFLLGVGERLVGNTEYCRHPEAARRVHKVGNLYPLNVEEIVRLSPEIVFISIITPPEEIEKLKKFGLKVIVFDTEKNAADIERNFLALGKITGREARARKIWNRTISEIEGLQKNARVAVKRPKVFVEVGIKPLVTAGSKTFLDEVVGLAGGENMASGIRENYFVISREEVLREDPDAIIIAAMEGSTGEETSEWKKFNSLRAVRDGRICAIDPDIACRPTPPAFVELLRLVIQCLEKGNK